MSTWNYTHNNHWLCNHFGAQSAKAFFLALCLALPGCQSSGDAHSGIRLRWKIEPDPPVVGAATINITLADSTGQLVTNADVRLQGVMSHPGMKPVFAIAKENTPGRYSATIEFTMAGDWFILVESALSDDRVVQRQIDVMVRSQ